MKKKRLKIKAYKPKKLDQQLFREYTDLLFEIFQCNKAKCARACGISRQTWAKWEHTPPQWPYWNFVLRHICQTAIQATLVKGGVTKKHQIAMETALHKLPKDQAFEDSITQGFFDGMGAKKNLYKLLATGGMYLDDILKPGNIEGYSRSSYHIAAAQLGVIKVQRKVDGVKRSYWRLPTDTDFVEYED